MRVLLSDPDLLWLSKGKAFLENLGYEATVCPTGKDCQLEVYRGGIDCLILCLDTLNYPGLMVMKYMMLNHPKVKVVLTIQSKKRLEDLGLDQDDLKKLGASHVLVKPFSEDLLLKSVKGEEYDSWKNLKLTAQPLEEEKVMLEKDEEFTRAKIESCQSGNITIFDHYIRLGPGRFIKVLRKGDSFDTIRIQKYIEEKKVEFLYFKTKDRTTYINFMNDLLNKMVSNDKASASQIVSSLKSVTEMYIEEVYTMGIKPQLVDEGKKICQNMYQLIQSDKDLSKYIRELQEQDANGHGHLFLVSFLSTIICRNLSWASARTVETIAMGGLLHDIGKLKLPATLRHIEEHAVPESQLALYRQHPLFGVELLNKSTVIGEPVKQIVYQHHELVNGMGYPNAFTAAKIYPLAKIISLADGFASLITSQKLTPIQGLRQFIPDKEETAKYDAMAIKSLVMGLTK